MDSSRNSSSESSIGDGEYAEESFFDTTPPPKEYDECAAEMTKFVNFHREAGRRVVLVTSGGTTVPLEQNTVRFVDNFSAGTRGSASSEYFLEKGYAVLFLHRTKSLEPFKRHFVTGDFLDHLQAKTYENGRRAIEVSDESVGRVFLVLQKYHAVKDQNLMLSVPFTTLREYLWLLRAAAQTLNQMGRYAVLYLAAAVSDFYLPFKEMSKHKIQSSSPLQMELKLVPKMLRPLVKKWVPEAYIISFKLETDSNLLISKAREALEKYGHEIVIANILETRKNTVTLVTATSHHTIKIEDDDDTTEIEEIIVENLIERHNEFI